MRYDVVASGKRPTVLAIACPKELDRGIEIVPVNSARAPDSHDLLPIILPNGAAFSPHKLSILRERIAVDQAVQRSRVAPAEGEMPA
jgi:hypothetical protein